MDAVTVVRSFETVQEEEHWDWIRRFKYRIFHLNKHLSNVHGYFVRYVAIVLLLLLLQAIVAEVQCSRWVSFYLLANVYIRLSFIIRVALVVVWVWAWSAFRKWWGLGVIVWKRFIFLLFLLVSVRGLQCFSRATGQWWRWFYSLLYVYFSLTSCLDCTSIETSF